MQSYPPVPESLLAGVERLRGITGFVTTLHPPDDPRPRFFARFYHVRRVGLLCHEIAKGHEEAGRKLDWAYLWFLAWGHDLHRWPFAHNLEPRGFPLLSEAVAKQLMDLAVKQSGRADAGDDLCGIASRRRDSLSPEAEICLLADMITGFFEDPLMVIGGLNLHPSQLPAQDLRLLGIVADRVFVERAIRVSRQLAGALTVEETAVEFDAWFLELASSFIRAGALAVPGALGSAAFEQIRTRIKNHLLCAHIYPLNNEHVSKASRIRRILHTPVEQIFDHQSLWEHDESSLVEWLARRSIISAEQASELMPDLDYVRRQRPEHRLC